MPTTVANTRTYRGSTADAVYVGRPSKYGNPFKVGMWSRDGVIRTRSQLLAAFEYWWLHDDRTALRWQAGQELRDKVLLCWCAPAPCHADILAAWVNAQVKCESQVP